MQASHNRVGANNERARDRRLYKKAKQELKTVNREYPLFVTFKLQKKAYCSDETSIPYFFSYKTEFFSSKTILKI